MGAQGDQRVHQGWVDADGDTQRLADGGQAIRQRNRSFSTLARNTYFENAIVLVVEGLHARVRRKVPPGCEIRQRIMKPWILLGAQLRSLPGGRMELWDRSSKRAGGMTKEEDKSSDPELYRQMFGNDDGSDLENVCGFMCYRND